MLCYCTPQLALFFFFFNDTATTEIYTLSLHDALPISVVPGGSRPAWSPDGGRLAFGTGQIWVLSLDGSGHIQVIDPRDIGGQHIEPNWSPDGARIVFVSTGCFACTTWSIYVMNTDGSGVFRLTHSTGSDHSP